MNKARKAPPKPGALPEKGVALTRHNILRSAVQIFGHQGLNGARTREIAKSAGVTQPLLIYHFKTKEDLWNACAEYIADDFTKRLERRVTEAGELDVGERLKMMIREMIMSAAHNPDAHRFMVRYLMHEMQTRRRRGKAAAARAAARDMWNVQIREAQAQGILPDSVDPLVLRFMIVGAATYLYLDSAAYEMLAGQDPHYENVAEAHVHAMYEMFFPSRKRQKQHGRPPP